MLTIDLDIARRFIIGKQGLWPGRRWRGSIGTEQAMREMDYLQLDPLQIIARSHDIALHSRVLDYTPGLWEDITYQQRKFFDWGGWLATRPMDELPHWRIIMRRERDGDPDCEPRVRKMVNEHAEVMDEIRALLRARGVLSNRDFDATERKRTQSYRGRKDSSLALYYLWRTGEVMTHHRENFERIYALTKVVAPEECIHESIDEEADRFLIRKEISFFGLSRLNRTSDAFLRGVPFSRKQLIVDQLLADGDIIEVQVEGWRATHYALRRDVELLNDLTVGRVPDAWKPLDTTTSEEVVFLAPLDQVSGRGRAKTLFNFDYVWEVYKPENKRKYGYYTMPVLWGDRLVARFDSKLDRITNTYVILGLWLEDANLGNDEAFAEALAHGFSRFVGFLGASTLDAQAINEPLLCKRVQSVTF
ncbi:MAG: winged helix-turn-helix domain-containing protein [Chloroflexi bacterium AL-W]|nr:winged helix-turn-helix domain-containing protein [Chloroflexi bacterium AL-N1]NOK66031.1 winged helix-turn-helix domain-containing protein [Chloroflexi bacterium AL-N10]NOK72912.1 winged helix-turn-helix domain-containing protein [Chloroflexi bacterium AL-N5]NOK79809.1 winged helix-turn-helix domain-containing protein [Chloroflexi bacterium AL-W]NOK88335.1 winged helix-turn-helix domain-containing protein [Chloroflexi bacterium AL-N15]